MFLISQILLFSLAASNIYIHENFNDGFEDRWIYSKDKSITHGVFSRIQKKHCSNDDFAIKSMNDSSYYHLSAKLSNELNTKEKPLYFQYVVQYEQNVDCGGAYIKLFSELDQEKFNGDSPYSVMVGPDVCGYGTRDVHLIISHKSTNYQIKNKETFTLDTLPHLIQLYIGTDKKFSLKIDGQVKKSGTLDENFDYLPPKQISDPSDTKPENWVDEDSILDPNDKKPEDWDERKDIPDVDAKKPEDWNDETDGEWERDLIKNPNYKGEWIQKKISNPDYKGPWNQKQIDNPDYKPDNTFADFKFKYIGFDLWTVKSGTVFDEIFISDSEAEADKHSEIVLASIKEQSEKIKATEEAKAATEKPATPIEPETPDTESKADEDREDL